MISSRSPRLIGNRPLTWYNSPHAGYWLAGLPPTRASLRVDRRGCWASCHCPRHGHCACVTYADLSAVMLGALIGLMEIAAVSLAAYGFVRALGWIVSREEPCLTASSSSAKSLPAPSRGSSRYRVTGAASASPSPRSSSLPCAAV
jgi:hypothetical protein